MECECPNGVRTPVSARRRSAAHGCATAHPMRAARVATRSPDDLGVNRANNRVINNLYHTFSTTGNNPVRRRVTRPLSRSIRHIQHVLPPIRRVRAWHRGEDVLQGLLHAVRPMNLHAECWCLWHGLEDDDVCPEAV